MIFCDTSFLFGFFFKKDAHYNEAHALTKSLNWDHIYVSKAVFEELITLVTYRVSLDAALKVGNLIMDPKQAFQFVTMDDSFFKDTWANFENLGSHQFSYVDMSLITLADLMDAKILSFDKALNAALAN